ncbi:hypothetical protein C1Y35_14020, partial [Pseudomonas sp. GW456-L14]
MDRRLSSAWASGPEPVRLQCLFWLCAPLPATARARRAPAQHSVFRSRSRKDVTSHCRLAAKVPLSGRQYPACPGVEGLFLWGAHCAPTDNNKSPNMNSTRTPLPRRLAASLACLAALP